MSVHQNINIINDQYESGHSGSVNVHNNNSYNYNNNHLNTDANPIVNSFNTLDTNNHHIQNINNRFSSLDSSSCLSDCSNTISFASLNVRGINNNTKFNTILEDLLDRSFSVIGLQETKATIARASS